MRTYLSSSFLTFTISLAILPCAVGADIDADAEYFEAKVRPLIAKRCYECHRRKAEGGLRVDSREALLKGGDSGPAIKPGDAENSRLWQAVSGNHDELEMPPKNPLKENEVKVLGKWIDDGAPWPLAVSAARATPDEHGISQAERAFWSFQPITRPTPPNDSSKWGTHPIDAFIASDHDRIGLNPNGQLALRQLIRRLSYDLTGLPPSPAEVAEFEQAYKLEPDVAYRNLVERLLESRAYAERWAQHWLDLVRYADTAGDAADFPIPEAYKYRNYVIDAFQRDMPYDRFVRDQIAGDLIAGDLIAGDLIAGDDKGDKWQAVVATGYIALSRRIGVSPHGLKHITIEDTINNVGKTFLGLSIGCARCHDHKFDPIPTSDYYAIYGIFDSTTYPHAGAEHKPYREDITYRVGNERANEILDSFRKTMAPLLKQERMLFERYREFQRKPINIPGYNRDVAWKNVLDLREQIRQVAETFPDLETAFAAREGDPADAHVQRQGDPKSRGPLVRRGFLQVLGGQTVSPENKKSGRLQLANWIASKDNPLTARVIANRVWRHHFGRGLVTSSSDFGARGEKPSHPELLDYLASYLIDHNWSIKSLHRLMLSSRTYQLASADNPLNRKLDPENRYLWRGNRRRLDAEQLRDSMLVFSNQLDETVGMRHPVPHRLTYFYRQHEPYIGDFESNKRTIYLFRQRIRKNRYLDMFDAPDGNLHVGNRRPTTTTLQSLYFMNSPFVAKQATAIASGAMDSERSSTEIVQWLYQHLYSRLPNPQELSAVIERIDQLNDRAPLDNKPPNDSARKQNAISRIVKAMLASNEFMFIE